MKNHAIFRWPECCRNPGLLLLLVACTVWSTGACNAQASLARIITVQMLLADQRDIPGDQLPWISTTLPYRLITDQPATAFAWFRFDLVAQPDAMPMALYLSNYMYSVDVYLNQVRIGGTEQPPGTLALGWTRPLLISLPARLLREAGNTIHIRLTQAPYTNVLPVVLAGAESALLPTWQRKQFGQSQLALVALVLCVLMGTFTLGLWVQRPHDREFAWFAGACLGMALPMFYLSVSYTVLPHTLLLLGAIDGIFLAVGCFLVFLGKILDLQEPVWDRTVMWVVGICALLMFMVPVALMPGLLLVVYITWFAGLAMIVNQAAKKIREQLAAAYWVVASIILLALIGMHDFYIFITSDFDSLNRNGLYLQYAIPLLLIAYFAQLVQRYIRALYDSELLGEQLEQRIAQVSGELAASYQTRRQLELEDAALQQRQKIYQDLHDDVGARLLAIVHARESQRQSSMAQSALASLRDTVSTSYVEALELPELVEKMADELGIRCRSQELDFQIQLQDQLPVLQLSSESAHHIWRILQEAVNNCIAHAQATLVSLDVRQQADSIVFTVSDNGKGCPAQQPPGGGMRNITYRASQLKSRVRWLAATDGGTCFVLELAGASAL